MNIENFINRKEKNLNSDRGKSVCGGTTCMLCHEYSSGGLFMCGGNESGEYNETTIEPSLKFKKEICEYCIKDLEIIKLAE